MTANAFVNNAKTVLLLGALTGLFVAVGASFGERLILPFLLFAGGMNLVAWFYSDRIAIAAMRGREVNEETGGPDF